MCEGSFKIAINQNKEEKRSKPQKIKQQEKQIR